VIKLIGKLKKRIVKVAITLSPLAVVIVAAAPRIRV
jgi:hypothetical protein